MKTNRNASPSWEKFLNPDFLKQNLLQGGLYLAAFEMLKGSLVGRPRDFFCFEVIDGEISTSQATPEYAKKVLSLHAHPYTASVLWWRNQGAISDKEVELLRYIREHRDQIAHNMPKMIGTIEHSINLDLLNAIEAILAKIDNWWIQNVEAGTDPEAFERFNQEDLDAATSMNSFFLSMMIRMVSGDDNHFRSIYNMWCYHKEQQKANKSVPDL